MFCLFLSVCLFVLWFLKVACIGRWSEPVSLSVKEEEKEERRELVVMI